MSDLPIDKKKTDKKKELKKIPKPTITKKPKK